MSVATKVTSKGQVTIPEDLRKRTGIKQGTLLSWEVREGLFGPDRSKEAWCRRRALICDRGPARGAKNYRRWSFSR